MMQMKDGLTTEENAIQVKHPLELLSEA